MIASHCDADHYGGLTDLLEVETTEELDCKEVKSESALPRGRRLVERRGRTEPTLGPYTKVDGENYFTQLVGDRDEVAAALEPGADPALTGEWSEFLGAAFGTRWTNNRPTAIKRLSSGDGYLPGFEPGADGEPSIKVLAPVRFEVDGKPAVRRYSADKREEHERQQPAAGVCGSAPVGSCSPATSTASARKPYRPTTPAAATSSSATSARPATTVARTRPPSPSCRR